jgi:GTP-binding protein
VLKEQVARLKRASKKKPLILSSATGLGVQDALRALAQEMDAAKRAEAEAQPAEAWQP